MILFLFIIIGCIVRYWGINFGLPHLDCRPDELVVVNIALKFGTGDLNPHFFRYPTFYMYFISFFYGVYYLLGRVSGKYALLQDFVSEAVINRTNFFLIDRYISAFFGVATIYVVYKLTKSLFDDDTGLVSSFLMSLAYLHVRDSHFGVTDVFMTFLVMCSIFYIIKCYKDGNIKNYIFAGIFGGLAMSTKYNGLLVIIPIFIVHYLNIFNEKLRFVKLFLDKRILFFIGVFVIAFLFGTPFALLDYNKFISDVLFEMRHLHIGHGIDLGIGWWYHLKFSLFLGLGWSLFFLSLVGIFVLMKKDIRKALILFSFPLCYYVLMGRGHSVFVRYVIPLIPFLCITAGLFITAISAKILFKFKKYKYLLMWSLAIFAVLPSVNNIINFDKLLTKKDNRLIVADWINEHIPGGSSISQLGSMGWDRIQLYPTLKSLESKYNKYVKRNEKQKIIETRTIIDYLKRKNIIGYRLFGYDEEIDKFKFNGEEDDTLPRFIVVPHYPLYIYSNIPENIKGILLSSYQLKKSFEVIGVDNRENQFDQQDAFYIPFSGFKNVERPGPNYYIYEKIEKVN